jgi:hypothetical protein
MKATTGNGCYTNYGNQAFVTRRLNEQMAVIGVDKTTASKLGDLHVTHASQVTCPQDCTFYPRTDDDIYGRERMILAESIALEEAEIIDGFSPSRDARIHVVGDCQTEKAANIVGGAMVRFEKRTGRQAYTYTHAWAAVPYSAWMGARVLASCETEEDIEYATETMGYPAAEYTYLEHQSRKVHKRGKVTVLPCPNNFNKAVTCAKCMKCADIGLLKERGWVIGLHGHGAMRQLRKALESASQRRQGGGDR